MPIHLSGSGIVSGITAFTVGASEAIGGSISHALVGGIRYRVHRFSANDTFILPSGTVSAEWLVVGGGGSSGGGVNDVNYGAGAAGGTVRAGSGTITAGSFPVVIGAGGTSTGNGGSSSFNGTTATGGDGTSTARSGGSNADYVGWTASAGADSGGGAGAGGSATSGTGGVGAGSSITGSLYYYGGGGGGVTSAVGQPGGTGGGGAGGTGAAGSPGINGTGGGAGGSPVGNTVAGGSGVVLVRYPIGVDSVFPGITLVASQSFTSASTVSVDNCFSAAYDNYLLVVTGNQSQNGSWNIRMRAAGVDNTASAYSYAGVLSGSGTSGSVIRTADVATGPTGAHVSVYSPFRSEKTFWRTTGVYGNSADGAFYGSHSVASQFDGFSLIPDGGTITGTVRVYGYTNGA